MAFAKISGVIFLTLLLAASLPAEARKTKKQLETTTEKGVEGDVDDTITWITGDNNHTIPGARLTSTDSSVLIGSFNMKQFGAKKSNNGQILRIIAKIIMRYDAIALQEITDVKQLAIKQLIGAVNDESTKPYHYILSSRVGRSKQKEQYALFYRPTVFQVKNDLLYPEDSNTDPFAREPHICELIMKRNGQKIALVNVHITPRDAAAEIDSLMDVHEWIENQMRISNIIILGDLNADCEYIRKKDLPNIRLLHNSRLKWLIPDNFDTTVGSTKCTYDRIIVSGPYLSRNWVVGSAGVFEFDNVYDLDKKLALNVSDHYPVEFQLRVEPVLDRVAERMESSSSEQVSPHDLTFYGLSLALSNFVFWNC